MKGMKGRILNKLRSIPKLGEAKQGPRILHVHASDGLASPPPPTTPLGPRGHLEAPPRPSSSPGRALRELPVGAGGEKEKQQFQDQQQHQGRCNHCSLDPKAAAGLCKSTPPPLPEPDIIDVAELMRDLEEDEDEEEDDDDSGACIDEINDKENVSPAPTLPWRAAAATQGRTTPQPGKRRPPLSPSSPSPHSGNREPSQRWCAPPASEPLHESPFRRPDPNAASLFDPDLLAAFEQAVMYHILSYEEFRRHKARPTAVDDEKEAKQHEEKKQQEREDGVIDIDQKQPPSMVSRTQTAEDNSGGEQEGDGDIWRGFELRCPPGGEDTVVLYTTSLRGIRKTFEDCGRVRFLLGSLRVRFCERDVSMHLGYRDELWRVLGGRSTPPRLFVRGRYVGGADDVLGLHEGGRLLPLLRGLPADRPGGTPCRGCGGAGFVVCGECSGSRKTVGGGSGEATRCPGCNENGLVVCALCSFWPCAPLPPPSCCSSPVVEV